MESLLLFRTIATSFRQPTFSRENIRDTNGRGKSGMLNILHLFNMGCDWYMVRHYNVSPLIENQYRDTCKRTCLDHNALLIKCDAVSAAIAVVLCLQHLNVASDNIDSLSIPSQPYRTCLRGVCVAFIKPVDKDKCFQRESLHM